MIRLFNCSRSGVDQTTSEMRKAPGKGYRLCYTCAPGQVRYKSFEPLKWLARLFCEESSQQNYSACFIQLCQ